MKQQQSKCKAFWDTISFAHLKSAIGSAHLKCAAPSVLQLQVIWDGSLRSVMIISALYLCTVKDAGPELGHSQRVFTEVMERETHINKAFSWSDSV